jgi:hypothetical protein
VCHIRIKTSNSGIVKNRRKKLKKLIKKYDGKIYTIKEYLPAILIFIFLIGFAMYTVVKRGYFEEVYLSTAFNEKVIDVFEERGNIYMLISNKENRYKIEKSRNYDYTPSTLSYFLRENDRVIKNKCSDTIYVERNSKKYHFLIGNTLYNNKEKSKEFIQKYNLRRAILNEKNDCN